MNQQSTTTNGTGLYPNIFSTCEVGSIQLPNRIVFPAWQVNYANTDGTISDNLKDFYMRLARGGCGLIFTGCAVVTSDGVPFDRVMRLDKDDSIPGLTDLFDSMKGCGAVPGIQLVHYGRQSSTSISGDTLLAPSPIPCPIMSQYDPEYRIREMTTADIETIRNAFIAAAARAAASGVQVVEIHAAHGYLLNQFLSPYSNKRTDAYGGTPENRGRLIVEIIEGVRGELPAGIAICVRISGDEFVEGGMKPGDFAAVVPLLEEAGMDLLSVAAGVYESMERIVPPESLGKTPHVPIAHEIKQFTRVPVCAVGSILSPETAESVIAQDQADLCAMGRAQVADPEIIKKTLAGREDEIRNCNHCNSCAFWLTGDPQMYCMVNPDYQKKPFMGLMGGG